MRRGWHRPRPGGPPLPGKDEAGGDVDGKHPPAVHGHVDDREEQSGPENGYRGAVRQKGVVDEVTEEDFLGDGRERPKRDDPQRERLRRVPAADHASEHERPDPNPEDGQPSAGTGTGTGDHRASTKPLAGPDQPRREERDEQGCQGRGRMGAVAEEQGSQDEKRAASSSYDCRRARPREYQLVVHCTVKMTAAVGRFANGMWSTATNSAVNVWDPGFRPWRSWVVL